MKKVVALLIVIASFLFSASVIHANQIGEALTEDDKTEKDKAEETSTLPPSHEIGEPQFEGELGEEGAFHQVKKGDTLFKIAGYYNIDFGEILDLNTQFIDPDLIYPNDLVKLPSNQVQGIHEAYFNY